MNHLTNFEMVLVIASVISYCYGFYKFIKLITGNYESKK